MDQIANMINMIKNASLKNHELVVVSHSKIKYSIAECLVKEGYLKSVTKKTKKGFPVIELELAYEEDGEGKVHDTSRVSKSSCRVYKGVKDLRSSRGYKGITVLSTPKGILTDKEARKEMVGGEVLFKMW
ncbi:MAG: 30S ribosomal protein S8 [Candidatus Moranbacteria bacterium]|nr:30S ribosomal protein S8 [Candidatus Moranbacteria bacterium]